MKDTQSVSNCGTTEIWKKVPVYNYEVSNMGRVRNATTKNIKAQFVNNCGYHQVSFGLKRDKLGKPIVNSTGKKVQYSPMVARLVAEVFIPNPNNYEEVNHISEDKDNNTVENLEWVTRVQNLNYGTRNQRHSNYAQNMSLSHRAKLSEAAKNRGSHSNNGVKVKIKVVSPDGTETIYASVREAARELGLNPSRIHYNAKSGGDIDGYTFIKIL